MKDRQEAKAALTYIYSDMERLGFLGDRVIAGYLKEGSSSFSAIETSAGAIMEQLTGKIC